MKKVMLHVCCGPCAIYPLKHLRAAGYEVQGFFHNPNIHPYKEFSRRLETACVFAEKSSLQLTVDKRYLLEEFLQGALQATASRCEMCYETRLRYIARTAKDNGCDFFTTSLLVSPHQKHDLIRQVGEKVAEEEGVAFLYIDLRSGWQEGVETSRALELYRQPYCGCIFSEKERYYKADRARS